MDTLGEWLIALPVEVYLLLIGVRPITPVFVGLVVIIIARLVVGILLTPRPVQPVVVTQRPPIMLILLLVIAFTAAAVIFVRSV